MGPARAACGLGSRGGGQPCEPSEPFCFLARATTGVLGPCTLDLDPTRLATPTAWINIEASGRRARLALLARDSVQPACRFSRCPSLAPMRPTSGHGVWPSRGAEPRCGCGTNLSSVLVGSELAPSMPVPGPPGETRHTGLVQSRGGRRRCVLRGFCSTCGGLAFDMAVPQSVLWSSVLRCRAFLRRQASLPFLGRQNSSPKQSVIDGMGHHEERATIGDGPMSELAVGA